MAALDAAHISSGAHFFAAKAGGIGGVIDGQIHFFHHLTHQHTGEWHFSRRHQPKILFGIVIKVISKLGQLPRGKHHLMAYHIGWINLVVTLADVLINHPEDQSTLQARASALEHIKARAGELHASFKINNAQLRTQIPMCFGFKIKRTWLPNGPYHHIVFIASPKGNVWVGYIGDASYKVIQIQLYLF